MTLNEFIEYLRQRIAEHGTQEQYASALGVSGAYLSDVLRGNREPGQKLLDAVGFERVATYRVKGGSDE